MPPAQLRIPTIKGLLGNLTNAQYHAGRETLYRFIVNIGFFHLWYYDLTDRERIWTVIFRILHSIIPAAIPNPGPGVVISRSVLMGVYHFFLACQKHILSNSRALYDEYLHEYDRCVLAGYDVYTCHHRGLYASNQAWATHHPGIPMVAPSPDFPALVPPPPVVAPMVIGGYIRKERGPPLTHPAHPAPIPSYLPRSFTFWVTSYPGPVLTQNFILPPRNWRAAIANAPAATISAILAALPLPGKIS